MKSISACNFYPLQFIICLYSFFTSTLLVLIIFSYLVSSYTHYLPVLVIFLYLLSSCTSYILVLFIILYLLSVSTIYLLVLVICLAHDWGRALGWLKTSLDKGPVCLYICLSVYLPICISANLPIYLTAYLPIYISAYLSICHRKRTSLSEALPYRCNSYISQVPQKENFSFCDTSHS